MQSHKISTRQIGGQTRAQPADRVILSPELIEDFLKTLRQSGCAEETPRSYRQKLKQLYQYLPEDKCIQAGTLESWKDALLKKGYAASTINCCVSAANSLMHYCGHRELQAECQLKRENGVQPELTRNEYLRLLSTARILGKEREYLLIKLFASTGIRLHDLPCVTVETVQAGKIVFTHSVLRFPVCLQEELSDYICRQGVSSGPVFCTRSGARIWRTNITKMIQALSRDAQVEGDKATPRCLRKLYQITQAGIETNIALLVEQTYERMLETEQLMIGWKQGVGING